MGDHRMNTYNIQIGDMLTRLCGSIGVVSNICEYGHWMDIQIMHSRTMGCENIRVPLELIGITWERVA